MSYQMSVTFEGDHILARSIGKKSYQSSVALWQEIVRVCEAHDCYSVLGIGESVSAYPTMDAYNHTKLFDDFRITHKYRIAWVELNPDAVASIKFLETVLLNRGKLNGRLFHEVEEARRWLLSDE